MAFNFSSYNIADSVKNLPDPETVDLAYGIAGIIPQVPRQEAIVAPAVVVRGSFDWMFWAMVVGGLYVFLKKA